MDKIKYVSIWKDKGFWKNASNVFKGLSVLVFYITPFDHNNIRYYSLALFILLVFTAITDSLVQTIEKHINDMKKVLFIKISFYVIIFAIFFLLSLFIGYTNALVTIMSMLLVYFVISLVFANRIRKSDSVVKYLYDVDDEDEPPFFSKKYFKETAKHKIVVTTLVIMFFLTIYVLLMCNIFLHWDWQIYPQINENVAMIV